MTDSEIIDWVLEHELGVFGTLRMENRNHLLKCLREHRDKVKILFVRAYLLGCLANDLNYKTGSEIAKEGGLI